MAPSPKPRRSSNGRRLLIGAALGAVALTAIVLALGDFGMGASATSPEEALAAGGSGAAGDTAPATSARVPAETAALDGARVESTGADDELETGALAADAFEISGRVLDAASEPVASASVRLYVADVPIPAFALVDRYREIGRIQQELRARTGKDGRFRFRGPYAEGHDYLLFATAPESAPVERRGLRVEPGVPLDAGDLRLEPGGLILGRVLDAEGVGAAHASVGVIRTPTLAAIEQFLSSSEPDPVVRADETGEFRIPHLAEGRYAVIAWSTGLARGASPPISVRREKDPPQVELRLAPGDSIHGVVARSDGVAVRDARIHVTRVRPTKSPDANEAVDEEGADFDLPLVVVSGETGAFEAPGLLLGERYDLRVDAEGYRRQSSRARAGDRDVRIEVTPFLEVRGIALDAETGRPVAGVYVTTFRGKPDDIRPRTVWRSTSQDRSLADGRFVAKESGKPGKTRVLAWGGDYAPTLSEEVVTLPGEDAPEVVVHLRRGADVLGSVRLGAGNAVVADATVLLFQRDPRGNDRPFRGGAPVARARTDEDGDFRFPGLLPATYAVQVRHARYGVQQTEAFDVPAGGATRAPALVLPAPTGFAGAVLGANPDFPVRIVATREDGLVGAGSADALGKFRLETLTAGTWQVYAEQPRTLTDLVTPQRGQRMLRSPMQQVSLRDGQIADVTLELGASGTGTIGGTVFDDTGAAVGCSVVLVPGSTSPARPLPRGQNGMPGFGNSSTATADIEGVFEFLDVSPGSYRVFAVPRGRAVEPRHAVASAAVQILAGGVARVDLSSRSGPLRGIVRKGDQAPGAGAKVVARVNGTRGGQNVLPESTSLETKTGKDGRFDFGRVPAGAYDLIVELAGQRRTTVAGDVFGSYTDEFVVEMQATPPKKAPAKPKPQPK